MRRSTGDFTLRQLDVFVRAARAGGFSQVADQLGISQPAVSDHITALERHLGLRLFDRRRGTNPVLTRDGGEMLQRAEALLATRRNMASGQRTADASGKLRIRVAIGPRVRDTFLRPLLPQIYTDLPQVELELVAGLSVARTITALEQGELDLLLATIGRPPPGLPNVQLIGHVPLQLVIAPQVAADIEAGIADIADLPFIMPDMGAFGGPWLENLLGQAGIVPRRPVRVLEFADVIQDIVEAGRGASILMEERIAPAIAAGRLVPWGPPLEPLRRIVARSPLAPEPTITLERMLVDEIMARTRRT